MKHYSTTKSILTDHHLLKTSEIVAFYQIEQIMRVVFLDGNIINLASCTFKRKFGELKEKDCYVKVNDHVYINSVNIESISKKGNSLLLVTSKRTLKIAGIVFDENSKSIKLHANAELRTL